MFNKAIMKVKKLLEVLEEIRAGK